jgi:soluble lytic murein transglycosylase-like protein
LTGVILGYLIGFALSIPLVWIATEPPAPVPVSVRPITEAQIKEDVKHEQDRKKVQRAIASARQAYRRLGCRADYSAETGRISIEFGLSPRLLAALVFVESSCNPLAKDGHGSIGLTQVNSKVWGHKKDLTNPQVNLRIGASILVSYVRRFGLVEGLHHYNGYSDQHAHTYVNKVLTAAGLVVSIPKG